MHLENNLSVATSSLPIPSSEDPQHVAEVRGLHYTSVFCPDGQDPFELVEWKTVDAVIQNAKGEVKFEQRGVEVPVGWSDRAIRIVASKYFRGRLGSPEREISVRQLVTRVVTMIWQWGVEQHYFATNADALRFRNDLAFLLLTQRGAFNSPVWFNLGVPGEKQQVSACFIQGVTDDMNAIAQLQYNETMIFKGGSGTGSNLSALRGSREALRGGGTASGPISFMRGFDTFAGVIKSGGKTRRAAKLTCLDIDHPDILEFIDCKAVEEKKARALIAAGFSENFDDPKGAYASVAFQNTNHSVRVTDDFMDLVVAALEDPEGEYLWDLHARITGEVVARIPVLELYRRICKAAWECGDPGLQFDTTINAWHTCPSDGRINASNPCSEFMFLDDSACNLASLNLMKFRTEDGRFDHVAFRQAVRIFLLAQEVMVDSAYYPTEKITENSHVYRPLGLGYANLGAYLMSIGVPYDSDAGRAVAAEITSTMTATAYIASAQIAAVKGPFEAFERNRASMLEVVERHRQKAQEHGFESAAVWAEAYALGEEHGFRNAQVTLLAPTGTIGYLMDCDTTGVEPTAALVVEKQLVGGGTMVLENQTLMQALDTLKYPAPIQVQIINWLTAHKCLDACPHLASKHLPVFDCALATVKGARVLSVDAHINMTASVQPFLSGAISKTMNLPFEMTLDQISDAFIDAWQAGVKSITVYRDGCKQSQPLTTGVNGREAAVAPQIIRKKLKDHQTNVHRIKFEFGQIDGYLLVTPYEDTGMPGEIFVVLAKEGSTISGLVAALATSWSLDLQHGVPLEKLVEKFAHMKFAPDGRSPDPDIRFAHSIPDAIVRKLAAVFLNNRMANGEEEAAVKAVETSVMSTPTRTQTIADNPPCLECGAITARSGATCFKCPVCGTSAGCS
jgi:ribonucleoside-diphosphate reductase alpha chain